MTSQLGTFPQIQIKIIFQYFSMSLEKLDLGKNLVQFINLSNNKRAESRPQRTVYNLRVKWCLDPEIKKLWKDVVFKSSAWKKVMNLWHIYFFCLDNIYQFSWTCISEAQNIKTWSKAQSATDSLTLLKNCSCIFGGLV